MKKVKNAPKSRVSLKDIAARLDTSVCTVSKALHNKPKVSPAMRAKVFALAEELNYTPNLAASSMARRPLRIAWIHSERWPSYYLPILQGGLHRAKVLRDFNISVTPFPYNSAIIPDDCEQKIKVAADAGFDAMVISPGGYAREHRNAFSDMIAALKCAVVMLDWNEPLPGCRICNVCQHSYLCGQMAGNLAQLLLPGNSSAGILIGHASMKDHSNKINGFRTVLEAGKLVFAGYAESADAPDNAYGAVRDLLQREPDLALLYVGTENIRGALDYLAEHHLLGRIKVIGTGTSDVVNAGLRDGSIQFALDENLFLIGETALDAVCRKLLLNQELPPAIFVPPAVRLRCQMDNDIPKNDMDSGTFPYSLEDIQYGSVANVSEPER